MLSSIGSFTSRMSPLNGIERKLHGTGLDMVAEGYKSMDVSYILASLSPIFHLSN